MFLARLEERTIEVLRSPKARTIGLIVGGAGLAFLGWSLMRAGEDAWLQLVGHDLVGLAVMFVGFALFQATGLLSLQAIGAHPANRIWAAAQLTKYLPVPGSAGVGWIGTTVHHGHTTRAALGYLVRHSLMLVGVATALSAPVVAPLGGDLIGLDPVVVGLSVASIGLAFGYVSVLSYPRGPRLRGFAVAVAGWAVSFWLIGAGFDVDGPGPWVVGAVFAAGWVAGQVVVPVPAGIGVREGAIIWIGAPVVGTEAALAFALLTRALHVVVDGGLVAAVGAIASRGDGPDAREGGTDGESVPFPEADA